MASPPSSAGNLPLSLNLDYIFELADERITTNPVDRKVIADFFKAALDVVNLRQYKDIERISEKERHCVRCHVAYNDKGNHRKSCCFHHAIDAGVFPEIVGPCGYDPINEHAAKCCSSLRPREDVIMENGDWGNFKGYGLCFEGFHTDNVELVEDRYNEINILRCKMDEEGVCARAWVKR